MSGSRSRPLISVTPKNPEVVYALFSAPDYSFHALYKSSDGGNNWIMQSNSPNILGRKTDGTSTGGQSWYNLSLGVSNDDENLVYVGGLIFGNLMMEALIGTSMEVADPALITHICM